MKRRVIIIIVAILASAALGITYMLTTKTSVNFQYSVKIEHNADQKEISEKIENTKQLKQIDSYKDAASFYKEEALKKQNANEQEAFWMSAVSEWKNALELDPQDKIVLNELGYGYFYLMNLSESKKVAIENFHTGVKYFNRILSIDPNFHWSIFGIGMLYFDIAERTNSPVEYLQKAIDYFDMGFEYDANYIWGHLSKAWAYFKIGNIKNELDQYRKAIPEFEKVLEIDQNNQSAKDGIRFSNEKL